MLALDALLSVADDKPQNIQTRQTCNSQEGFIKASKPWLIVENIFKIVIQIKSITADSNFLYT